MKRRTVLGACISGLAGSLAVGSGAFTTVEAERTVTTKIVGDDDAFLVIDADGIGGRSGLVRLDADIDDPYQATFRIPGPEENLIGGTDPKGIGQNSVYKFGSLAVIRNQGTQPVEVYSDHEGTLDNISIFDEKDPDTYLDSPENAVTLGTGEGFIMGLRIESGEQNFGEYNETVTIIAESGSTNGP
ncbi:hypothetical protein [Halorubrum ezzemoulense]|uniref:hypothetical protein n=1 Tax=Halorubrum ezzemoulense TaxID=337243 RepID=UPI001140211D|nr:hypothetical protein [Halorubrum ezzemoulense]